MESYGEELKRMYAQQGSEIPRTFIGATPNLLKGNPVPMMPITQRLAELASHASQAGAALQEARERFIEAARHKEKCEQVFAQVSGDLMTAIHTIQEGTPENVPYQP